MQFVISAPGLDELVRSFAKVQGMDWRHTRQAIEKIAEMSIRDWQKAAQNPKEKHAKWFGRHYASSITVKEKRFTGTNMRIIIGPTNEGAARVIEEGRGEYDMKNSLRRSQRARRSKKGNVYTIVGFRHGMKVVIEAGIGESFSKLKSMEKMRGKIELNAFGEKVSRNVYSMSSEGFGKRLGRVTHKDRKGKERDYLSGMVKTRQEVGKQRGKGQYQYQAITFRTVGVKSTGWMFPAIKGQKISKEIYKNIKELGSSVLQNAIKADLLRFISGDKTI